MRIPFKIMCAEAAGRLNKFQRNIMDCQRNICINSVGIVEKRTRSETEPIHHHRCVNCMEIDDDSRRTNNPRCPCPCHASPHIPGVSGILFVIHFNASIFLFIFFVFVRSVSARHIKSIIQNGLKWQFCYLLNGIYIYWSEWFDILDTPYDGGNARLV